ncbi:hypothetical protein [Escherichia coli]
MSLRKLTDNCKAVQVSPCGWDVIANDEKIGEVIDHTYSSLADHTDQLWEGVNCKNNTKRFKTMDEAICFVYTHASNIQGNGKWHM